MKGRCVCSLQIISALDSGSSDLDSSPGRGTVLCSLARHFPLIVALFTQVYGWVLVNLMLEGNSAMDFSIPSRGKYKICSKSLHATEPRVSSNLMGPLGS